MTNEFRAAVIAKETLTELLIALSLHEPSGVQSGGIGPANLALSIVQSVGRVSCLQTSCCSAVPSLESVGILEKGVGDPEPEVLASHHIVRRSKAD